MPEPNCACATGWNAAARPIVSAVTISLHFFILRLRLVWHTLKQHALLLCSDDFFLNCKAIRLWLTPRVSIFFLASRAAICSGVSLSRQKL